MITLCTFSEYSDMMREDHSPVSYLWIYEYVGETMPLDLHVHVHSHSQYMYSPARTLYHLHTCTRILFT